MYFSVRTLQQALLVIKGLMFFYIFLVTLYLLWIKDQLGIYTTSNVKDIRSYNSAFSFTFVGTKNVEPSRYGP